MEQNVVTCILVVWPFYNVHVLIVFVSVSQWVTFMQSLSLTHGTSHSIRRSELLEVVVALYQEKLPQIRLHFAFDLDERGIDMGGMAQGYVFGFL